MGTMIAQLTLFGIVAQAGLYIDIAEVAGQGAGIGSVFALFASMVGLVALAGGSYVGMRWFHANYSKSTAPPVSILSRDVRRDIQRAIEAGNLEEAGDILARAGENEEAAETYVKGAAFLKAARTFQALGSHGQAIYCFKKAGDYRQAARIYEADGQPRDAAAEFFRVGEWALAAGQYQLAGDFRRAAENFERAQEPLRAAQCFEEAGIKLKAAEHFQNHFEQALAQAGGDLEAVESERQYARRAGDLLLEADQGDRASEILIKGGFLTEAADSLRSTGNYTRAAELLMQAHQPLLAAKVLEDAGEQQEASRMRAEAALDEGDKGAAAHLFRDAGDLERAAQLFDEAGQASEAATLFEKLENHARALELYVSANMQAHAARCAELCDQLARAAELYREAGDVEGQLRVLNAQGDFFRAGRLQFEHRRFDEAIRSLENIDSRDPIYARGLELQGDIFRAQGRAEKAYSKYRAALGNRNAEKASLGLYYKMARALEEEPDLAGALECYSAIVEIDPNFEDAGLRQKTIRGRLRRGNITGTTGSGLFSASEGDGEGGQRYEILEEIARGGMGIVYKARDTVLGRIVAFKILGENLRENETAVKYFLREARAAAALSHPNIVTIFDAGEQDGEYYMAMEFVEGTTLKELVRRSGALPEDKVRYILINCCRALQYAHSKGIIHRDIKSGNVMTTREKALKVMDFGLAKFLREYQNNHTQQVGTPFYMSPEQIIGKDIDFRSDLYSLGCTVFECATGTVPFFKGDLSYHHLHTPPPSPRTINPAIGKEMERVILKLLEKDPNNRYQTAKEVLDLLG
ncbi:MAG: protein kinase [Bradymonadaceae bacterium]|nr:protein kinase [Lujinxingiaceae bacterium]